MGRKRKEQLRREREEKLARYGPPVMKVENYDYTGDFESTRPLYDGEKLPWEEDIAGFIVAHDRGVRDDLKQLLSHANDAAYLEEISLRGTVSGARLVAHLQAELAKHEALPMDEDVTGANKIYTRLDEHEIRVLELMPGEKRQPLQGVLLHVNIDSRAWRANRPSQPDIIYRGRDSGLSLKHMKLITYTAVSYCWSTTDERDELKLSGHDIKISSTVAEILAALRHASHPVRLWIDQICIDQTDVKDKENQIKLMGMIYQQAYNTLIWLGHGPEEGAFHLLQSLAYGLWGTSEDDTHWQEALQPMIARREVSLRSLMRLFQAPWFQRTWIVQELAFSSQPWLLYGSLSMSWSAFTQAATYLADFDVFLLPGIDPLEKQAALLGVRSLRRLDALHILSDARLYQVNNYDAGVPSALVEGVLENTRSANVSIPIDKVYAVMSLCGNILPIDYSLPNIEVFEAVSRIILQQSRLATHFRHVDHDCEGSGSPSWVIDWSLKRQTTPLMTGSSRPYQNAGGPLVVGPLTLGSRTIGTQALIVDTLIALSDPMEGAHLSSEEPLKYNVDLRRAIDFVSGRNSSHVSFNSFCATLVAGQNDTGLLVSPEAYVEVLSLLCDESTGRKPSLNIQTYTQRQQKGHFTLCHLKQRLPKQTFRSLKQAFCNAVLNRKLAWSEEGHIVLVPRYARAGDVVVIVSGCPVPYVMRPRGRDRYSLVGECYAHALMDGKYYSTRETELSDILIE